jgi:hypothetical protein
MACYPTSTNMRSEGNVYNPVPEKVPKVRDADEFVRMKAKYEDQNSGILCVLTHPELQNLLATSDCTDHFNYLQILASAEIVLSG